MRLVFLLISALAIFSLHAFAVSLPTPPATHSADGKKHYKKRIAEIKRTQKQSTSIVMLGDSITQGCDWSGLFPHVSIANHGIGWDTIDGVLNRLEMVKTVAPQTVFLRIGTNNIGGGAAPETVAHGTINIAKRIHTDLPNTTVVIQSILPREPHLWTSIQATNSLIARHVNSLKQNGYPFVYVDHSEVFSTRKKTLKPHFTYDGIHLNQAGCRQWSEIISR